MSAKKRKTGKRSDVKPSMSQEELLARITELEEENDQLRKEKESHQLKFLVDVNENLKKLQTELKDRVIKYSESIESIPVELKDRLQKYSHALPELKMPDVSRVDIVHWVEAAAASRKIDPAIILQAVSVKKRQLFAVALVFCLLPGSMLLTCLWLYAAVLHDPYHILGALLLVYCIHIYFDKSHEHGSYAQMWLKRHSFWKVMGNYFPVLVVKQNSDTVYDPEQVYMFGYHPHGIISVGCFVSFAADATGVSEMFPGIKIHPATLNANFHIPFWRELLLRLGVIGVSAKALHNVLDKGPGSAALVVPGGAAEALDAHPGTHALTLNRRQGFFRIALQHGASLVPIYSFGENDLYEQAPNDEGSFLRKCQNMFLKYAGFATPFFSGAGSSGGAIPMSPIPARVPVVTVIGDPIRCPKIEHPTQEDIDKARVQYVKGLHEIFDKFADKYAPARSGDLEIVH